LEFNSPKKIEHSCLPESVQLVFKSYQQKKVGNNHQISESESGKKLLRHLTTHICNYRHSQFTTQKYEKPAAVCDGHVVSVSFSHTANSVAAVLSGEWVVGIDMESTDRAVSNLLSKRMKHPAESLKLYRKFPIIQVWTLKEAALKTIGTGLRKPMNGVKLEAVSKHQFNVEFFNGIKGNICSFQVSDQWISVCYIQSKLAKTYLEKSYVPIHARRDKKQDN